jgi:hypothetical protein
MQTLKQLTPAEFRQLLTQMRADGLVDPGARHQSLGLVMASLISRYGGRGVSGEAVEAILANPVFAEWKAWTHEVVPDSLVQVPAASDQKAAFYTVTNEHTKHTNQQSHRYLSFEQAEREAVVRCTAGDATGVYILAPVALVRPKHAPTETIFFP